MQNPILLLIALSLNKLLLALLISHPPPADRIRTLTLHSLFLPPPIHPRVLFTFALCQICSNFLTITTALGQSSQTEAQRHHHHRLTRNLTWFFIFPGMCFPCCSLLGLVPACCVLCVCVVVLRPKTDLSDCVVRVNNLPQLQSHHITSPPPICLKLSINCSEKLRMRPKYYR